jgi:hypothetical protein
LARHLLKAACSLQFEKRCELFLIASDKSLSVVAVCISNEDCSTARIHSCDAAPTPTGFAEMSGGKMTKRREF